MQIHTDFHNVSSIQNPVVTIGTYDGVHIAHQQIIERVNQIAKEANGESVLITFDPHPRQVLDPSGGPLELINTLEERKALLERFHIDHLVLIEFTIAFSELTAIDFVNEILVKGLNPYKLVIGYDHHFGKDRQGSIDFLKSMQKDLPFGVEEIPKQMIDDAVISSTEIRNFILTGDIESAEKYLGHEFTLTGIVVKGRQIGQALGFPTANMQIIDKNKIIPGNGAYAVKVSHNTQNYIGMLNIGVRPTLNEGDKSIEVHIIDFNQDIYQDKISVTFVKRIRDELKFDNMDDLKAQLIKDKEVAESLLK